MKGYLYIVFAASLWGMIGPVGKFVFAEGITPMETAFWRAALAWIFFSIHAFAIKKFSIAKGDLPTVILFGVLCISLFYSSYQIAILQCGAALASVLLYTAPAWVAFLSCIFFREKMGQRKIIALFLIFIGIVGVSFGPKLFRNDTTIHLNTLGIVFGLISGFSYALYYIFGKKLDCYVTPTLFLYAIPVGLLGLYPFIDFKPKTHFAWSCLLFIAFCSTYIAYNLYYAGLKSLEATRAAVVATLEPVIATILAFFWWNEEFHTYTYFGSALILLAVFLIIWPEGKTKISHKPVSCL